MNNELISKIKNLEKNALFENTRQAFYLELEPNHSNRPSNDYGDKEHLCIGEKKKAMNGSNKE